MDYSPVTIELNPREQRLYDRLRQRMADAPSDEEKGGEGIGGNASLATTGWRDLLLLFPDLTILLLRLLRDKRVPILEKGIAVAGIAYVLSPIDVLPAIVLGPIGFLDDLFIVAACLSRVLNHVHPDVVRGHWSGKGDALDAIQGTTHWFEAELKLRVGDLRRFLSSR